MFHLAKEMNVGVIVSIFNMILAQKLVQIN